jgi:hypothetical protein
VITVPARDRRPAKSAQALDSGPPAAPAAPPPLAALDNGGSATVISYQVPEPMSYEGRHVISLDDYVLGDFAGVVGSGSIAPVSSSDVSAALNAKNSITVPSAVVLSDSSVLKNAVIALSPFDLTPRLQQLTWADVSNAVSAAKRVQVFRSTGGLLDYRVRDVAQVRLPSPTASGPPTGPTSVTVSGADNGGLKPALRPGGNPPAGGDTYHPRLTLTINAPAAGSPVISGPWNGVTIPVTGVFSTNLAGTNTVQVKLMDSRSRVLDTVAASIVGDEWSAGVPVTASGTYTLAVVLTNSDDSNATGTVPVTVALAAPPENPPATPPAIAPSVTVTQPVNNAALVAPDGNTILTVAGTADTRGGSAGLTVKVTADNKGPSSDAPLTASSGTAYTFSTTIALAGEGMHQLVVTCVNADGLAAPAITLSVGVSHTQPIWPFDRRLVLIEKIMLSSFLGNFGASRVVKTFTLLPGETTQISVDSYTKDESTAKSAQSILDSTSSECAGDFEDTVNEENDNKASNSDATTAAISADIGASYAFAHADIKASYSDQANASREQMAKTVSNALTKHTNTASSNRTVNVNTDFSTTTSSGLTTDTSRTLRNINVSRVLNFVFRQMTQEHIVLTHLTDVTLGVYKLDILLDAAGNAQRGADGGPLTQTSFIQYTLPEIADFARTEMTGPAVSSLQPDILNVLANIADINGQLQSIAELVTPTDADGNAHPDNAYIRIKRNMTSTYTSPAGSQFTVPGILLDTTTCVMRTDQLLCDAILGQGDALDEYSHALQDVAIAERQAAVDERVAATAREKLAQQIITTNNTDLAGLWSKIFPPPLSVPATVTVPAADGEDLGAG